MHTYLLLDRSGSMGAIWAETLASIDVYVQTLADDPTQDHALTIAVFDLDSALAFDVLRRNLPVRRFTSIGAGEARPRGSTPLFDAIGRLVALVEGDDPAKAVVVIVTDGFENASVEFTKETAKAALDRLRAKGLEVVFLGAEFASFSDADGVGVVSAKSMAMASGRMGEAQRVLARKAMAYARMGESVEFDEHDRAASGEADVEARKGKRGS
jgi:uncharacterized protein YegL